MNKLPAAEKFADSLKNNPKEIIEFCKKEIAEYEALIKIIEASNL